MNDSYWKNVLQINEKPEKLEQKPLGVRKQKYVFYGKNSLS